MNVKDFVVFILLALPFVGKTQNDFTSNLPTTIPQPVCNIDSILDKTYTLINPSDYQMIPDAPLEIPDCTGDGNSFQLQNPYWYEFVATNTVATMEVVLGNCQAGSDPVNIAVQYALITDVESLEFQACNSDPNGLNGDQTLDIIFFNLIVGQNYYFVIDGFAGTICDYEIVNITGFGDFPLDEITDISFENFENDTLCLGVDTTEISVEIPPLSNIGFSEFTDWQFYMYPDTQNPILDTLIRGIELEYVFTMPGKYRVKIVASNSCSTTPFFAKDFVIVNREDEILDPFEFCILDLPALPPDPKYLGPPIDTLADTLVYTVMDDNGCIFNQYLPLLPNMPGARLFDSIAVCDQDSVIYENMTFYSSDTFNIMIPNPDTNECDQPVTLYTALLDLDGEISVSNCEDGSSIVSFNPTLLEPSTGLDSIIYVWTNRAGDILSDTDGIDSQLEVNNTDSIFLNVAIYRFGVSCSRDFQAFAEPLANEIEVSCLPSSPGSVMIGWNDLIGIDQYIILDDNGDTLSNQTDTSYIVNNLMPGSNIDIVVQGIFSDVCPPIVDTISCTVANCDTILIDIQNQDTTICLTASTSLLDLSVQVDPPGESGFWSITNGGVIDTISNTFDPLASGPGSYELIYTISIDPCFYTDTFRIVVDEMPDSEFNLADSICETDAAFLMLNNQPPENAILSWDIEGNESLTPFNDSTYRIFWDIDGEYQISLQIENGSCQSSSFRDTIKVKPELETPDISCFGDLTRIDFSWQSQGCVDSFDISIDGVFVETSADTFFRLTNINEGDIATISVLALSDCACQNTIDSISCQARICPPLDFNFVEVDDICLSNSTSTVQLQVTPSGGNNTGSGYWSGIAVDSLGLFDPILAGVGSHTLFYIFEEDGCNYQDSLLIAIYETPELDVIITDPFCVGDDLGNLELQVTGVASPFEYFIDSAPISDPLLNPLAAGQYQVIVVDTYMCSDTVLAEIKEPQPIVLDITVQDPLCPGDMIGNISISVVEGGLAPFDYFINGIQTTTEDINVRPSGTYEVEVIDMNNCSAKEIVLISASSFPSAIIEGPTSEIEGIPVSFSFTTSLDPDSILTIEWTYNGETLCDPTSCMETIEFIPIASGMVCVSISFDTICPSLEVCQDLVLIPEPKYYFPNVFKPSSEMGNDVFWVYTNDPNAIVENMSIYDRWGNLVYAVNQAPLEGSNLGWDGTLNGELVNPGVFVFVADLQFSNGAIKHLKGNITLIR